MRRCAHVKSPVPRLLTRLMPLVLVTLVALSVAGCMKTSAQSAVPVVVISVARLDDKAAAADIASISPARPAQRPALVRVEGEHAVGDRVEVEQHDDRWLPATLIERRGDRWLVHYDERRGAAVDDPVELVEPDRIRIPLRPIEDDSGPDDVDP